MSEKNEYDELLGLTTEIVSAFVGNNAVAVSDLPMVIGSVYEALRGVGAEEPEKVEEELAPAVPIRKSIQHDYLVCLEDGKKLKMLKRHLATRYDMSPDDYRRRWGLPHDYPMVAPAYAAQRSALAKEIGLGRKPQPEAPPAPAPTRRRAAGRKKVA